jgi:hypothetical protein
VETDVRDGELRVRMRERVLMLDSETPLRVEIRVPDLTGAVANGASDVVVDGIRAERFHGGASGASSLRLSGAATDVDYEASGASRIEAGDLTAMTGVANASGASRIEMSASERIDANASGASSICYRDEPDALDATDSGASSVERCPDETDAE